MRVPLLIFIGVLCRTLLQALGLQDLLFSSKNSVVLFLLLLWFHSQDYNSFQISFCLRWKVMIRVHYFTNIWSTAAAPFFEKKFIPLLSCFTCHCGKLCGALCWSVPWAILLSHTLLFTSYPSPNLSISVLSLEMPLLWMDHPFPSVSIASTLNPKTFGLHYSHLSFL